MKYIPQQLLILLLLASQSTLAQIDPQATPQTKALYKYLHKTAKKHSIFGHQHATEYGHGWAGDSDRSDVKSITGSHPGVIGVDLSGFTGLPAAVIARNKANLRRTVADTYNRGGITTVAWHFSNPASGGGFYWRDSLSIAAIPLLKPGGSHHQQYKQILQSIGSWAKTVKGADSTLAPMIFRPYHEFDGNWFWWGAAHCSPQDFVDVWRFTVHYLRDSLQVHNLLYAYSPDNKFSTEAQYLDRYPGHAYVDMLGVDNYGDFGRNGQYNLAAGIKKLQIVDALARKHGKLAAFTETGLESLPDPTWWTHTLLKSMTASPMRLAYVLVWRNDRHSATHYYAPYPSHPNTQNFVDFYNHPYTLFEADLGNVYGRPRKQ
jgi:mannan endo-1,4-beta-mannosidase